MKKSVYSTMTLITCVLFLAGCTQSGFKQKSDDVEVTSSESLRGDKKTKPITKKVSKEVYPNIEDVENSLIWHQEDAIIKRFETFQNKYQIEPDLTVEDIKKKSEAEEIPLGLIVGDWMMADEYGDEDPIRIDLIQSDKESLNIGISASGYEYSEASPILSEAKFNNKKGVQIEYPDGDGILKLNFEEGKMILQPYDTNGQEDEDMRLVASYLRRDRDIKKITTMADLLADIKVRGDNSIVTIEPYADAHLGYVLTQQAIVKNDYNQLEVGEDFENSDILSYSIDPNKQIAKLLTVKGEKGYTVTYIYRTPLGNYQIVSLNSGDDFLKDDFYPNAVTTNQPFVKNKDDKSFAEKGTTYIYGQEPIKLVKKVSDIDESEILSRVKNIYLNEEGYFGNPYQMAVHGVRIHSSEYNGQIFEQALVTGQTHTLISYELDEEGNITTEEDSVINGKNIFDEDFLVEPIITTAEEGMAILKSTEWLGNEIHTGTRRMKIDERGGYHVTNPQIDSEASSIDEVALVGINHLKFTGMYLNVHTEYHIFFYPDGSISVASAFNNNAPINLPGHEDKLEFFTPVN